MYDSFAAQTDECLQIAGADLPPDYGRQAWVSQPKPILMKADRRAGAGRFRLYIAGDTLISQKARANLHRLCERCAMSTETLVIDVLSEPALADKARILATPTLVYDHPARSKRIVGDLSDIEKVFEFLGLQQRDEGL